MTDQNPYWQDIKEHNDNQTGICLRVAAAPSEEAPNHPYTWSAWDYEGEEIDSDCEPEETPVYNPGRWATIEDAASEARLWLETYNAALDALDDEEGERVGDLPDDEDEAGDFDPNFGQHPVLIDDNSDILPDADPWPPDRDREPDDTGAYAG